MAMRELWFPRHLTGWTSEELERFMAGEWFSGAPFPPEQIEEMREELRRQLRERDERRAGLPSCPHGNDLASECTDGCRP